MKELGIVFEDCPCLVSDLQKVFGIYWALGRPGATIPRNWPKDLDTQFNMDNPMDLTLNGTSKSSVSVGCVNSSKFGK